MAFALSRQLAFDELRTFLGESQMELPAIFLAREALDPTFVDQFIREADAVPASLGQTGV